MMPKQTEAVKCITASTNAFIAGIVAEEAVSNDAELTMSLETANQTKLCDGEEIIPKENGKFCTTNAHLC